jgi:predicted AlkP superfamily pyrophosphatase or phosphodiesterase
MKKYLLILMAVLGLLAACISCSPTTKTPPRMVILGIDGWGSAYLDSLPMPVIRGLMAEGTYTFHKRSVMPSASSINWASIFNGLPTQLHGFTKWNSKAPEFPVADVPESGIPVTVFTLYRERYPEAKVESLYEWDGVKFALDTVAFDLQRKTLAEDATDSTTTEVIDLLLQDRPDLFYVHYDAVDHAGHTFGWGSPEYNEQVAVMDRNVGRILDACKEAGLYDDTYFVLVSDHGGKEKKHGGPSVSELEAPFIIIGPGIKKGAELEGYMLQYDVAATLASVLGLPIPAYWRGRPVPVKDCR